MDSQKIKEQLAELITQYKEFKKAGKLDLTSEETIRTWLNELLSIFGWDVRDTSQILQEKVLSAKERKVLKDINSVYTRPDYTFRIAKQKLTFLDAKNVNINILTDAEAAFQIKSYGWSIAAPCAFISNFEEFAIYDCTYIPEQGQDPVLGRIHLTIDNYIENFEVLADHLAKENIYGGRLNELYAVTLRDNKHIHKITPDIRFAGQLSIFRLALAADILQQNTAYINNNASLLSYIVQIIINRVLFIRVCEARKIEEDELLLSFRNNGFWNSFRNSSYLAFYEHYDGPLFDRINDIHQLKITDTVFDLLLENLYYPSPYRFDVIPTKLLSDIYEIFLSKKLVIESGKVRDELKPEYSKTKGAVSTPQYIVQDIIKRTIPRNKLLEDGIEKMFSVKILDIACGSGAFTIEAFDYLEDIFLELYQQSSHPDFDVYFFNNGSEAMINLSGKRAIVDNCIFGVDINPEAVEVAKMSLSLKMIDNFEFLESYYEMGMYGSKILEGVGNNMKCGNSLVESDILTLYPDIKKDEIELTNTNIFDWHSEDGFGQVFNDKKGFDYIIGNPPYVEVKNYNIDLPFMHLYIKKRFYSAKNGKIDLAIPFLEQAILLLNDKGRVGFIIQKRFFKTNYGKRIRQVITRNNYLSSIIDFDTTEIFKDRMTYVALLILDKTSPASFTYKSFKEKVDTLPSVLRETPAPHLSQEHYLIVPSVAASVSPWAFDDERLIEIRTRLLKLGKLGDYADVKVGIQALWDNAYHIRPKSITNGLLTGHSHIEDKIIIEVEACRSLLCNERFYPYRNDQADVYVIFPYDVKGGVVSEILFPDFIRRYPLAGAYLLRNRNKIEAAVETLPRKNPQKYTADYWHLYTRVQNHGATYPKIIIPMTALDTFAAVTLSDETYCDNANVFFIGSWTMDETTLYALSAIINSTVYSVLARSGANPQSGGYFKLNKQFLEPVPFPCQAFDNNSTARGLLAKAAKDVEHLQRKYIMGSPSQKRTYALLLKKLWLDIDDLTYELYALSSIEIEFFRARGRNVDRIALLN